MNQQMLELIDGCINVFNDKEKQLKENRQKICDYIDTVFKYDHSTIQARVKNSKSLREKLIRWGYHTTEQSPNEIINDLTDLIGIRIVCLLTSDEVGIYDKLLNLFSEEDAGFYAKEGEKNTGNPYLRLELASKQPQKQKNGFPIYRIDGQWLEDGQVTKVELQIKSLADLLWGEIEHMLFYKNYSYIVDQFFYKQLITSIRDSLTTVDFQLGIIKDQLHPKNDTDAIITEIEQFVSWIIYYHNREPLHDLLGCEIDFREVYSAIIYLYFKERDTATYEDSILSAREIMQRIMEIDVNYLANSTFEEFDLEAINELPEKLRALITTLGTLTKNIFWHTLIILYGLINDVTESFANTVKLATIIASSFEKYSNDSFEINTSDEARVCMETGLINGLTLFLGVYGKIDFILPSEQKEYVCKIAEEFVSRNQEDISDNFDPDSAHIVSNLIAMDIYIKISIIYKTDIDMELFSRFYELYKQDNHCWKPPLDTVYIDEKLSAGSAIDFEEIVKLYQEDYEWINDLFV